MHCFRGHHHIVGCTRQRIEGHMAIIQPMLNSGLIDFPVLPPGHWQLTRNVPPGTLFVRLIDIFLWRIQDTGISKWTQASLKFT